MIQEAPGKDHIVSHVRALKSTLSQEKDERWQLIYSLEDSVSEIGLDQEMLSEVFDIIFDVSSKSLHSNEKRYLIRKVLVPNGLHELHIALVYRIIGSIGYPRVYYQNDKKVKQKKLPSNIQNSLLQWLIASIHLFGEHGFKALHKLSPILFNLLSFEFCRPLITNLIFLCLSNTNKTFKASGNHHKPIVKNWQIQTVVDLATKFPLDPSLKVLLVLFKEIISDLDYRSFSKAQYDTLNHIKAEASVLKIPRLECMEKMVTICEKRQQEKYRNHIFEVCQTQYATFRRNITKRRRLNTSEGVHNLEMIANGSKSSKISIHDITTLEELIIQFEQIEFVNFRNILLNPSYHNKQISFNYIIFKYMIDKEDKYFSDMTFFFDQAIPRLGETEFTFLEESIVELLGYYPSFLSLDSLQKGLSLPDWGPKLLRFCGPKTNPQVLKDLVALLSKKGNYKEIFLGVAELLNVSYKMAKEECIALMNELIPFVFELIEPSELSLEHKLSLLKLLRVIKIVDEDAMKDLNANVISLPSTLYYELLFTINPIVVSEACGFLAFSKTYKNYTAQEKVVINSIVFDTLNFLWRDKAFYKDTNSQRNSKGMYFAPEFINKLPTINVFNYTSLVQLENVGNMFHNPVWSYLVSQILWEIEDKWPHISTRHPGPVTKESVASLVNNPSIEWLDTDYDSLKVQVLRGLDKLGYNGLGDLLFGSLRTIASSRDESPLIIPETD
ncbi:hypothetical protein PSN45_004486 [Yamadazyma tenuis]|uniref:Uncharacterized protein n=1 Tax=Candida tenuis (strain ATCC 10573 / BCRC 21748 / CBS 615 / JCM 9827 / NBRC 10315 / NRRL Y-1498 / VKM Y-70) TaxID=590646 RepID=G3B5J4_CANTC|nr:uncharacterized protein CANTEDRAFT_94010 [Yamadazyma tenuis ATCC 10573]EGV63243.1 hypothetical protein CANTEDRAFT_94010 [Yamadazyma tenuis ATCC 10573]WEJ96940.1 hypothetical protein PSN45_004486 [Yamadazyma tenuis]